MGSKRINVITTQVVLAIVSIVMMVPFYWMVTSSFKPIGRIFTVPIDLIPHSITLANYHKLLEGTLYLRWYANSIIITVLYVSLAIFFSTLAGFGFAKYDFKGKNILMFVVLASMMIPLHSIVIPLFMLLIKMKWVNSYQGVVLPFSANAFGIFYVRQFLTGVPSELIDAGRIDGCSEIGIYYRIILPLLKPAVGVLTIYFAMISWNWFLWPLVVMRDDSLFPLNVGIATFISDYRLRYDELMAASVLSALPIIILFLLMQKKFVSGLTAGAVKS